MATNEELAKEIEKLKNALEKATQQRTQQANKMLSAAQTSANAMNSAGATLGGATDVVGKAAGGDLAGAIGAAITAALAPIVESYNTQRDKALETPEKRIKAYGDSFAAANVTPPKGHLDMVRNVELGTGARRAEANRRETANFRGTSMAARGINAVADFIAPGLRDRTGGSLTDNVGRAIDKFTQQDIAVSQQQVRNQADRNRQASQLYGGSD